VISVATVGKVLPIEPIRVQLTYASDDPYAVRIDFSGLSWQCTWEISRDLLRAGADDRFGVGRGDVHIMRTGRHVYMRLDSEDGRGIVCVTRAFVKRFLAQVYALVPVGEERAHLDIDADIAELLNEQG
jgi:hypothetical protein